jgi:hypothetical protein
VIEEFRYNELESFAGLPIVTFDHQSADKVAAAELPDDVAAHAWRVSVGDDGDDGADPSWQTAFGLFLDAVDTSKVTAFVIGAWQDAYEQHVSPITDMLVANADRFPALTALFVADMGSETCEVSWIQQSDATPLLAAFPKLTVFGLRGGTDLELRPFTHENLTELVFQSGGLPAAVVRSVGASTLPALTSLDLYLGSGDYGGDTRPADLADVFAGTGLPALTRLGLRDADNADEIAAGLAQAPIVARLTDLDLSLGTLSDDGAAALLAGQSLTHLATLDLHRNYLSDDAVARVRQALPHTDVDASDQQSSEDQYDRYPAVTE